VCTPQGEPGKQGGAREAEQEHLFSQLEKNFRPDPIGILEHKLHQILPLCGI
jgi:hypothetical protein